MTGKGGFLPGPVRTTTTVLVVVAGLLLLAGTVTAGAPRSPGEEAWAVPVVSTVPPLQESVPDEEATQETDRSNPWYRTPWAWAGYGIGVIALVVVLVRWRTASLERRRRSLEDVVAERTREVRRQKRQLEAYNRELLRTNETLRHALEEKSRLLGMAAHDLKNPLFGIRALSEILLETEALSEKSERKLTLICESANETLHLIDDLLSTAAGAVQNERDHEAVDLAVLTQWVVRSFEPQAERKEQALSHAVATDEPCVVTGDRRKLREAVGNLVGNALKYSPPGEDVDVRVDRCNDVVQVAVSDDGPGLSERDQERMFAPFQRLSPEPTGGEGSSGLGLYIVKQIVDQHGGTIDVESAPGVGSTFVLALPAAVPEGPTVPETGLMDVGTVA
jgi:signal transduction histidine kinase